MKSPILLICTLFVFQLTSYSQGCLPEGITFTSQTQIDSFQFNYPNCTEIEGDVVIESADDIDISDLFGLSTITSIAGSLSIVDNYELTSLEGLGNLLYIGSDLIIGLFDSYGIGLCGNPLLTNLSGLDKLSTIGGSLKIIGNHQLNNLQGLNDLTSIGGNLVIGYSWFLGSCGNNSLSNVDGLENLTFIGGSLKIYANHSLTNLLGLNGLTSIGEHLFLEFNSALTDLIGLHNLYSIGGSIHIEDNNSLTNLSGLLSLETVGGDIQIQDNDNLIKIEGFNNLNNMAGNLLIIDNDALISLSSFNSVNSIEGLVVILINESLTNLLAFSNLISVGEGYFGISGIGLYFSGNASLKSLTGLENLCTIDGDIIISGNKAIFDLTPLHNLQSISGGILVTQNELLTSVSGLNNIAASTIESLDISYNPSLSTCAAESICDYLISPNGEIKIQDNALGCNSQEEVQEGCDTVSVEDIYFDNNFTISPNPCSGSANLRFTNNDLGLVICDLFEISGVRVKEILNEEKIPGNYEIKIDLGDVPAGIYFCTLKTKNGIQTRKIIKL